MNIKNEILVTENLLPETIDHEIITREDVVRLYKKTFQKIERILDPSNMMLSDFKVGKRKHRNSEEIYFFPKWGFISFDCIMNCCKHELEDVLDDLYDPKQIRSYLISLLKRLTKSNLKKINDLNTELGFVKNLASDNKQ